MKRIKFCFLLCSLLGFLTTWGQEATAIDSLKALLREVVDDTVRVKLLADIASAHWWEEDYPAALPYARRAIAEAQKSGYDKWTIYAYMQLFDVLFYQSGYKEIKVLLPEFKDLVTNNKDTFGLKYYYHCKADILLDEFRPDSSLLFYRKALALTQTLQDTTFEGLYMNNIAYLYLTLEIHDRAQLYLHKCLKYSQDNNNAAMISYAVLNLGYSHLEEMQYDSADYYFKQSYDYSLKSGYQENIANALSYQGLLQLRINDLDTADSMFTNARKLYLTYGYQEHWGEIAPYFAELRLRQGRYTEAIRIAKEGNALNIATSNQGYLVEGYKVLADVYQEIGSETDALFYLREYSMLKDSLYTNILQQRIATLEVDYKLAQTETELALALARNVEEKQLLQLKSQQLTLLFSIFLLMIVIGIVGYLYYNYLKKAQQNEQLEQEVQARTADLNERNEQLNGYVEELKNFTYVTSHDLKEPLRNISGFTSLLERRIGGNLKEDTREFMTFIRSNAQQMHRLVEGIQFYTNLNFEDTQAAVQEEIDLQVILKNIRISLASRIKEQEAKILFTGVSVPVHSVREILQLVLKNIIENGIKYNHSETPTVVVSTNKNTANHEITIRDNGIGINPEYHEQVFQMFKRLHTRKEFDGTGMGLAICRKVIRRLGGEIRINSEEGKGSTFIISLRKNQTND